MKSKIILMLLTCSVFLFSCQDKQHEPLVKSDRVPAKVTNPIVENDNGGAKITYTLPDDPDILYVLAVFDSNIGERVVKSSVYKNYVLLNGFADTDEHIVNLYTVSRSEVRSEPVAVKIQPLIAPIKSVFATLEVAPDFGGVNARFTNEKENEFVFHTMYKNNEGVWVDYDRLYTNSKTRDYSVRGLPSEPIEFGFFFTDKWKNSSDTLFKTFTPIFEVKLDNKQWKHLPLDNDFYKRYGTFGPVTSAFDGDFNSFFYQDLSTATMPNWWTIDLGQQVKFSRMDVYQAPTSRPTYSYNYGTPRSYEIWGSNNPTQDGSWDNWTLLVQCESVKPSESPVGVTTPEDRAYAMAGENYNFPSSAGTYRYIRFKTLRSWTGAQNLMLTELVLYGQPQ